MVYIGSEAKWRLYYEGGVKKKKIPALAVAEGRHINMFSAVISTAVRQSVRVKENEAKEKKKKRWILAQSPAPYLGIISGFFYTDFISAAVYSITVVCVGSCAYPLHL